MKQILAGLGFLLMMQACDPAHTLVVKASKKNNASVTIHANSNILGISGIKSPSGKKISITVPDPSDSSHRFKKTFFYGFGTWPDYHVRDFASLIDSIVFINEHRHTTISGTENIYNYLKKNRSGILRTKLKIKAS